MKTKGWLNNWPFLAFFFCFGGEIIRSWFNVINKMNDWLVDSGFRQHFQKENLINSGVGFLELDPGPKLGGESHQG
jgi:hypothetical protein